MTLIVGCAALPALAWLLGARTRRVGWIVGLALVGWLATLILLVAVFPRAGAEAVLGSLLGAALIVAVGHAVEDRRVGGTTPVRGAGLRRFSMASAIGVTGVCAPLVILGLNTDPFIPSADELLPVPAGLVASVDRTDGTSCGSGVCDVSVSVRSGSGQPVGEVQRLVRDHLSARGWRLDDDGRSCRPAGWLLDRRTTCVDVRQNAALVRVTIEGHRAFA
ncbi:hypothetical protein AB0J90_16205 [Micromonospora sp. NPDC049523]|uniref:hypothetical protein n=1 Tax=Micromonospora sp. NPDC049523 TaxID=3155921 RepID=UPI003444F18F